MECDQRSLLLLDYRKPDRVFSSSLSHVFQSYKQKFREIARQLMNSVGKR